MGVPTTFDALVERYDSHIRKFLCAVTAHSPDELDDAVQDVYVRFMKNDLLNRYESDKSAFTSYLFMVCRSVAQNNYRSRKRVGRLRMSAHGFGFGSGVAEPAQEWELLFSEVVEFLEREHPKLVPVLTRLMETGRLRKRDAEKLRDALEPVYA